MVYTTTSAARAFQHPSVADDVVAKHETGCSNHVTTNNAGPAVGHWTAVSVAPDEMNKQQMNEVKRYEGLKSLGTCVLPKHD